LAEVIMVSENTPITGVQMANSRYDGSRPATISVSPKVIAAMITSRCRIRPRRAARRAPDSEPIARVVPSRPYSPAPLWNTSVAIRAEVIWKFRPKVPAKNTMVRISIRSGRASV
jgi:hypothetical protein